MARDGYVWLPPWRYWVRSPMSTQLQASVFLSDRNHEVEFGSRRRSMLRCWVLAPPAADLFPLSCIHCRHTHTATQMVWTIFIISIINTIHNKQAFYQEEEVFRTILWFVTNWSSKSPWPREGLFMSWPQSWPLSMGAEVGDRLGLL